jgi:hypothetical protein
MGTPCTWPLTFWFKPVSAFGLLEITAFISSSPELAMPSTLASDRLDASSRRVLSRETRPPGSGEVTLSQELRTVGLLRPHVLVGYQWSHTGLCPGCRPVITATSAASCRTPSFSGHGYPTQRAANTSCPRSGRFWLLELRVSRTFLYQLRPKLSGHGYPARPLGIRRLKMPGKGDGRARKWSADEPEYGCNSLTAIA